MIMENEIGNLQKSYLFKRTEILICLANEDELTGFLKFLDHINVTKIIKLEIEKYEVYIFKYKFFHICYFVSANIGARAVFESLKKIGDKFPNLQYVVNIGCCATVEKNTTNTVIIADRIFDGGLGKETKNGTQYAVAENRHIKLANKIRNALRRLPNTYGYEIEYKPLIATNRVVKNEKEKNKLIKVYPYAAGIEMEGMAISDYALLRRIEWIVIKGISDNAVNKNGSEGQERASFYAAELFFIMLDKNVLKFNRPSIFVSGALNRKKKYRGIRKIEDNCIFLGDSLLKKGYKIINGLGYVVGTCLVSATYKYRRDRGCDAFSDYMEVYPFPRSEDIKTERIKEFYNINRETMVKQSLVSLFVYGKNTSKSVYNGVKEEYDISGENMLPRIIIPCKGFFSNQLFDRYIRTKPDGIDSDVFINKYKEMSINNSFEKNVEIALSLLEILDDYFYNTLK